MRAALGVERLAVLGHSIVGMLAVEYARRRPETVSHAIMVGTPPRGDMTALQASTAAYFEQHASDERKRILRENIAALSPATPPTQAMFAQTPLRFFDPHFDALPLFAGAEPRPEMLMHLLGALAPTWDVTAGSALRARLLIAHGRHDYTVPHLLWDAVLPALPDGDEEDLRRERPPALRRGARAVHRRADGVAARLAPLKRARQAAQGGTTGDQVTRQRNVTVTYGIAPLLIWSHRGPWTSICCMLASL